MSKQEEQRWQAESDADTMARYQEIIGDKARIGRAVKIAKQRASDLTKRATAMQNVAKFSKGGSLNGSKSTNRTSSKVSSRGRKK